MDNDFIVNLLLGSFRDPILWILSIVIASSITSSLFSKKLLFLALAGIIWGYIRLYVYKSFGQEFSLYETLVLIMLCLVIMVFIGSLAYLIFKLFKSET
ncbi:MAG: hypothetical protein P8J46_06595 [Alphaproteobacteria bacterium]|nr:hypothetical protein [Alphaproteobacteria bacterium]